METKERPTSPSASEKERMVRYLDRYTPADASTNSSSSRSPSPVPDLWWWKALPPKELRFIVRISKLPRDVWAKVLLYVFTAKESERVIDPSYRPPNLLRVNRMCRRFHGYSYYKGLTATFHPRRDLMAMAWLKSLPQKHRNYVKEVKLIRKITTTYHTGDDLKDYMRFRRSMMFTQLFDWIQRHIPRKWKHHIREAIRFEEHVRTPDGQLHIIRV